MTDATHPVTLLQRHAPTSYCYAAECACGWAFESMPQRHGGHYLDAMRALQAMRGAARLHREATP